MNSNSELELLITILVEKLSQFKTVLEVRLFGSQIVEFRKSSDIDVFVSIIDNSEYENIIRLFFDLSVENKVLFHPVITSDSKDEIISNIYTYENIINKSKIIFKKI